MRKRHGIVNGMRWSSMQQEFRHSRAGVSIDHRCIARQRLCRPSAISPLVVTFTTERNSLSLRIACGMIIYNNQHPSNSTRISLPIKFTTKTTDPRHPLDHSLPLALTQPRNVNLNAAAAQKSPRARALAAEGQSAGSHPNDRRQGEQSVQSPDTGRAVTGFSAPPAGRAGTHRDSGASVVRGRDCLSGSRSRDFCAWVNSEGRVQRVVF